MSDKINTYKTQAHALVDTLYDLLTTTAKVSPAEHVSAIGRIYVIEVKGDYERVVLTVEDEWSAHVITYDVINDNIELRRDALLFQNELTKGAPNYYKLTALLDDLISLLERWVETSHIEKTKEAIDESLDVE